MPELALPGIGGIFESRRDDGRALPLDEPLAGARLSNEALLGAVRALSVVKSRGGGAAARRLRQPRRRRTRQRLRVPARTHPALRPRAAAPTRSTSCRATSARSPGRTTRRPRWSSACSTRRSTRCWTRRPPARPPQSGSRPCSTSPSATRPAGPGTSSSPPPAGSPSASPPRRPASPSHPNSVVRAALRRVTGRCIYGVDVNPMAAELAKVSLWLEALEPGKPLSYLDQNIRVGNSLLGITPALLEDGLPDAAFTPIEGDDRKVATALRKQNAAERSGQHDLFSPGGIPVSNADLAKRAAEIARELPDSLEDLHIHQQRQAWNWPRRPNCASRSYSRTPGAPHSSSPRPTTPAGPRSPRPSWRIRRRHRARWTRPRPRSWSTDLARQYRFFHWHVEFPHIFRVGNGATGIDPDTGWAGGFSCVIGNPPWERVKLQEQEFFAADRPEIANAANAAARKKMIAGSGGQRQLRRPRPLRRVPGRTPQGCGWSHLLRLIRPLSADRARRRQYLRCLRRDRPHGHRALTAAPGWCCPPESRPTRPPPRSSATWCATASWCRSSTSRMRPSCSAALSITGPVLSAHRLRPRDACRPGELRLQHSLHRGPANSRGSRCRLRRSCWSTRTPAPPGVPIPPRRRDHHRHLQACSSPLARRASGEPLGPVVHGGCSTWPTTRACSGRATSLNDDGWTLTGNVFVRDGKRMLPLYEAKMIHHFDHRYGTYEGQTQAQARHGHAAPPYA